MSGERSLTDDQILAEMARLLRRHSSLSGFIGSKARGDIGPDSDYDLLIVVPDEAPLEQKRSRLAYQALRGTRTVPLAPFCLLS
jgi:predicted nucleotidyltransferase